MKITKISQISGREHTIDIPMDEEEFKQAYFQWENGVYIQTAFHKLSPPLREFIKSGITPQEWIEYLSPEEDDD